MNRDLDSIKVKALVELVEMFHKRCSNSTYLDSLMADKFLKEARRISESESLADIEFILYYFER